MAAMSEQQIDWDLALIQKYNYSGPRYTSYPTALEFSEDFEDAAFLQAVARYPERPADQYLDALEQEIRHRAPLFADRHVSQLHWAVCAYPVLSQVVLFLRLQQDCHPRYAYLPE